MKTAEEWYNGLHVRLRDFADPDCDLTALFRAIQADALRHAAELCRRADISRNPDLRITCWKMLRTEADKLTP